MSTDALKNVKELLAADKIEEAEKMMVELMPKALESHGQNDLALGMAEVGNQSAGCILSSSTTSTVQSLSRKLKRTSTFSEKASSKQRSNSKKTKKRNPKNLKVNS